MCIKEREKREREERAKYIGRTHVCLNMVCVFIYSIHACIASIYSMTYTCMHICSYNIVDL